MDEFILAAVEGRDGLYRPALCFKTGIERWYVFSDAMGICFRNIKDNAKHDFTSEEMKKNHFGIYRVISQKWNAVSEVLKKSTV